MNELATLREGIASLNRRLDKDEFQEQMANELLYLRDYTNSRRQLIESLRIRATLYEQLQHRVEQRLNDPTLLKKAEEHSTLAEGLAVIIDDLEALHSGILTMERELETIETKRKVFALFEASAPASIDLAALPTDTLKRLKGQVES